jgi:hypothetical protein
VSADLSLITLISEASLLVKLVMLTLLIISMYSWMLIFKKHGEISQAKQDADKFEDKFWSGNELNNLYEDISSRPHTSHGMEGIFEVGFKGRYLDGRLAINGAIFETEVEDNQFFEFFAGPWGLLRVVTSIDELDISGSELDFKYALTDNLRLDGGIGFTDGKIKKNTHRPNTVGNNAPLAPEHTYNLGMQYETAFSANYDLIVRVDYMEVGETFG